MSDLRWEVVDGKVTITGVKPLAEGHLEIPAEIEGLPVVEIGDIGFCSLEELTIPDSVVSLTENAFSFSCLERINIGAGIESISPWTFHFAQISHFEVDPRNDELSAWEGVIFDKLRETLLLYPTMRPGDKYVIPDGVKKIGANAFLECRQFQHIVLPDSVTEIGDGAFSVDLDEGGSNLTSIRLSQNLTHIGGWAFNGCWLLEEITMPASVTFIGDRALDSGNLRTAIFDGAPPELDNPFSLNQVTDLETIYVWPEHAASFSGEGSGWESVMVRLRDTTPKISELSVDGSTTTITISGGSNRSYLFKSSADLQSEFRSVVTEPTVIMTDATGSTTFTVETEGARRFFQIEEAP